MNKNPIDHLIESVHILGENHDPENFRGCTHIDCKTLRFLLKRIEWNPMSTAPRDGIQILVTDGDEFFVIRWCNESDIVPNPLYWWIDPKEIPFPEVSA